MRILVEVPQGGGVKRQCGFNDIFGYFVGYFVGNFLQFADKDQQESRAMARKPHDDVVKFDTYRNLQRHHAVLPAIARLTCITTWTGDCLLTVKLSCYVPNHQDQLSLHLSGDHQTELCNTFHLYHIFQRD